MPRFSAVLDVEDSRKFNEVARTLGKRKSEVLRMMIDEYHQRYVLKRAARDPMTLERRREVMEELVRVARGEIPPEIVKDIAKSASEALNLFLSEMVTAIATHVLERLEGSTETKTAKSDKGS